jgi:hypothetical protein
MTVIAGRTKLRKADEDDRLILTARVAACPAMVEITALRDLDGVQYSDEAVQRLREDGLEAVPGGEDDALGPDGDGVGCE